MFRSQLEYKMEWNGGMLLSCAPSKYQPNLPRPAQVLRTE